MGTGIGLFLDWENGKWVTGTGNDRHKNGNRKTLYKIRQL
jgi:hypothetical protein